jgi:hypothetical protein
MQPVHPSPPDTPTVADAWRARLPEDRRTFFEQHTGQWEQSYTMFSIVLNDALTARSRGALVTARQQVACASDLARRLSGSLVPTLQALSHTAAWREHLPPVIPLQPALFRNDAAHGIALWNWLLHRPLAVRRLRFALKLSALRRAIVGLSADFLDLAAEIAQGLSVSPDAAWRALEALHDDLNTVLREAFIILKAFLSATSSEGFRRFHTSLTPGTRLPGFAAPSGISPAGG